MSGYELPEQPDENGTIIHQPGMPVVGIWIMPDNSLPGMLEDFIAFLVPDGDPLWNRASDCLQQIPPEERRFTDNHQNKAHLHTWLAWQKDPGTPMGLAITKSYLDADAPNAQRLIAWLRRLFEAE